MNGSVCQSCNGCGYDDNPDDPVCFFCGGTGWLPNDDTTEPEA